MKFKYKNFFVFIIIVSLAFFAITKREKSSELVHSSVRLPVLIVSTIGKSISKTFSFVPEIANMRKENYELRQKIISLQVDRSMILELENENELLKQEVGYRADHVDIQLIPAKIIQRDPITFLDYVIVDKGSRDGVVLGKPVIFAGALIGRVAETYEAQSKIVLITSKDSIIQGMLQESRAKGVLRGGISGLFLDNVVLEADMGADENVVTSGLGGSIRQGILIGQTKQDRSNLSKIFKTISVEPAVDLSKLEVIFIEK